MESKDLKIITIHQGQGDDELEMTVQVTQAEFDKMEEIRSKDPLLWDGKELDLVKAAKELIIKEGYGEKELSSKRTNWKLLIGVVLGIVVIVGTLIFVENINKKPIEESPQNTSQNPASNNDYSDNIHKLYLDAIERGLTIDEQTFYSRIFESGKSRREIFYDLKDRGMKVNYEEFLNYIGLPIDWQKVLDDFSATKDKYPNLTNDQDWYRMFPEFNNDHSLLQAAFDYDATVKSGKYSDENELRSKFPEFWPDYEWNSKASQNIMNLYDYLHNEQLFEGTLDDFKNSLMSEIYRNTLYQFLSEKQVFDGSYSLFCEELDLSTNTQLLINNHKRALFDILTLYNYDLGDYNTYSQKLNDEIKRRKFYDAVSKEYDIGSWEEFNAKFGYSTTRITHYYGENFTKIYNKAVEQFGLTDTEEQFYNYFINNPQKVYEKFREESGLTSTFEQFIDYSGIPSEIFKLKPQTIQNNIEIDVFTSKQYGFTYQYDKKEFDLVEKINKNTHCVMKLQSPKDEIKSILVSVWENSDFSSAYDPDFMESCQSVDQGLGSVIRSATKTKVGGVNALKSELKISPMGKSYYAAIYRIIHKKRMYMLNIYIPIEEYNKDKSYGDKCANNFKFN